MSSVSSGFRPRLLFVHQNFPAQFKHLAPALKDRGFDIKALVYQNKPGPTPASILGITCLPWSSRRGTNFQSHPWAQDYETKLIRAECVAEQAKILDQQGWQPDLIIGHPGWGETLFLKLIWPHTPQLHFLEFFYSASGLDVGFDPEFSLNQGWHQQAKVHSKTAGALLALHDMDIGISPTHFQAKTYPNWCQNRIHVIHDGIDTLLLKPDPQVSLTISTPNHIPIKLTKRNSILTFVNRNLEPYRGYHRFMRALPALQKLCPELITIIIGGDSVSYGAAAPKGLTWKQIYLEEVSSQLDLARIFYLGNVQYEIYRKILQLSTCHVYYTYPFVLGWSCLEALSSGCIVIGSDTDPVREVIDDNKNGFLVDFFDQDKLIQTIQAVISNPNSYCHVGQNARLSMINQYDLLTHCLPRQLALIDQCLNINPSSSRFSNIT